MSSSACCARTAGPTSPPPCATTGPTPTARSTSSAHSRPDFDTALERQGSGEGEVQSPWYLRHPDRRPSTAGGTVEQYTQSLKRAAILADFERRLRDAL